MDEESLMKIASEYGADLVDETGCSIVSKGAEDEDFVLYPLYGIVDGIV